MHIRATHVYKTAFFGWPIKLWNFVTTLLAITRLLDFWVHYPTLPYLKLKNHYSSGPAYPPAQCQYMNNRHIQISSTIVPNYYQSLANLPLLGHSAKPMPILGKSVNLIKPISHTRTDKCGAKLVSNANSPIWYQSWTNPPIHCQSFANPMPILDQSSDQLQVHLPIQW